MGLFSGSSKSSSTTSYVDQSENVQAGAGDFLASDKNIIAGGDVYNTGVSEDMVSNIFSGVNELYQNAFNWVAQATGTQQQNVSQVASALNQAYNSESATLSGIKSYALYALIGFLAWSYISKMR